MGGTDAETSVISCQNQRGKKAHIAEQVLYPDMYRSFDDRAILLIVVFPATIALPGSPGLHGTKGKIREDTQDYPPRSSQPAQILAVAFQFRTDLQIVHHTRIKHIKGRHHLHAAELKRIVPEAHQMMVDVTMQPVFRVEFRW